MNQICSSKPIPPPKDEQSKFAEIERKGIVMLSSLGRQLDVSSGGPPSNSVFTPNRVEDRCSRCQTAHSLAHKLTEAFLLTMLTVVFRFIVQMFRVEGFSMEPTLHHGQCLIVNRVIYCWLHLLQRGDIITFKSPYAPVNTCIKRVIGLPSEKVEVRQGRVYINDQPLDEPYTATLCAYNWGPDIVPRGQYFVLGDNRNKSSDSHSWGWLPDRNIIGKALISYWPPQSWGMVSNVCK